MNVKYLIFVWQRITQNGEIYNKNNKRNKIYCFACYEHFCYLNEL